MLTRTDPYEKTLSAGLVMRSVAGPLDVDRLAAFSGQIHGPAVAAMTRQLILHHPHTRPEHWLYVEDTARGAIVSTLCLIPWTLQFEGIPLRAGEMGIVATDEAYRRRGLIRAQAARHAEMLRLGEYHLSHIQGIPFFYRQFGYEYAMPLEGGWRLELDMAPEMVGAANRYTFREATAADIPDLVQLYDTAAAGLGIGAVREPEVWHYLLGPSTETEMLAQTWLVVDGDEVSGYLRIPENGFGEGLVVNEASIPAADAARSVLHQLVSWATARAKPYVRLCLPPSTALVAAARSHGAHTLGHYAWQVKIVDVPRFSRQIAPALERRVAASPFSGLTRTLCLDVYRTAYQLEFERGRLVGAAETNTCPSADLRLPPFLLPPLLLGYRSREELSRCYHDVSARGESQQLVDVLFPKMSSFLYTVY